MKISTLTALTVSVLLSVFISSANCDVYTWTDANGVAHFSDTPVAATDSKKGGKIKVKVFMKATSTNNGIYDLHPEGPTDISALKPLSYTGTQSSLRNIQRALLPAAKIKGNCIAIALCRQTCIALGQDMALEREDGLPKSLAKTIDDHALASWFSVVEKKAEAGDPFFKTAMAIWYLYGNILPHYSNTQSIPALNRDINKGLSMLQKASATYSDATAKLGQMYMAGLFLIKDDQKAFTMFVRAVKQGSIIAAYNLGKLYREGRGVRRNIEKALYYYKIAAEKGFAEAQFRYGLINLEGYDGIEKNIALGKTWMIEAANQKYKPAVNYCRRF